MSLRPFATVFACIGILLTLGATTLAPASVAAQADERKIEIWLESPPSVVLAVDLRLSQSGTDITDTSCGPITTPPDSPFPRRSCTDLGDGTFAVSVTGVPAGANVTWSCIDIVAAQTDPTDIPLGGGFTDWRCTATVSPPGVVIDAGNSVDADGNPLDGLELSIEDETGTAIGPCEIDTRGGIDRQWCVPLADGTYEAIPQDIPPGLRAAAACSSLQPDAALQPGPFVVDAANPLWFCEQPLPFAPLIVGLSWEGAAGRDRTWIGSTEPTLTASDGNAVDSDCTEANRSSADTSAPFVEFSCVGVAPGSYTVTFSGIPGDFDVSGDCDPIVVPETPGLESELCYVNVTSEPLDVPTPDEPADDPTDGPESPTLPDTGTPSRTVGTLGLAVLLTGVALLLTGRRRSAG